MSNPVDIDQYLTMTDPQNQYRTNEDDYPQPDETTLLNEIIASKDRVISSFENEVAHLKAERDTVYELVDSALTVLAKITKTMVGSELAAQVHTVIDQIHDATGENTVDGWVD